MMARFRAKLTYANVMATGAVFIALGGTSYAAITITGKNVRNSSLTGADVRNSSLTGADVRNSSLTGADVKNESLTGADVKGLRSADVIDGSLLARDFAAGQLPAGPPGRAGDTGPAGPAGPAGQNGATSVVVRTNSETVQGPFTNRVLTAACAFGERATGGSANSVFSDNTYGPIASRPTSFSPGDTPTGWQGIFSLNNTATVTNHVYAVCAAP